MMSTQVENEIQKLVQSLTPYEPGNENFTRCVNFITYHTLCKEYSIPSQQSIQQMLEKLSEKYNILGFSNYSEQLSAAVHSLLNTDVACKSNQIDENVHILDFLLKLSSNPFKTDVIFSIEDKLKISRAVVLPEVIIEEEKINWHEYLQEGSEKYKLPTDESEEDEEESVLQSSVRQYLPAKNQLKSSFTSIPNEIFDNCIHKETVVNDENVEFIAALKDSFNSKTWLMNNQQNSWWYDKHNIESDSKYPSATFGISWEKSQNDLLVSNYAPFCLKYQYYSEYKIIRELFWIIFADHKQILKRIEFLRSQISIPSLIQETFASFINDFLQTVEKYHVLSSYFEYISDSITRTSCTFQAYASALKHVCEPFVQKIIELEDILRKQDCINTLLTVCDNLRMYLKEINFIFEIHNECISSDMSGKPAWLGPVRLLSVLFSKFEQIVLESNLKIILEIFFETFRVYADIIDRWLSEGQLCDLNDEFIIKKLDDGKYVAFPFENEETKFDVQIASFLLNISKKLLNCSENIEFLSKLNKVRELRCEILKEGKLIDVFTKNFISKLRSYATTNIQNESSAPNDIKTKKNIKFSKMDYELCNTNTSIAYLVQAFNDKLDTTNTIPNTDDTLEQKNFNKVKLDLSYLNLELVSVSRILEDTLYDVIAKRESIIMHLFESSLVNEYKFFEHLQNLSGILLMDLHGFYDRINTRLEKNAWGENHLIKTCLYDCVERNELPFENLFHFTMMEDDSRAKNVDDVSISNIAETVNYLHLQYRVQWPMKLIFNDQIINEFYEPLLKLILKVNFASFCITRLQYKNLPQKRIFVDKYRRIQVLRFWIVQLLQKLRYYLMLNVSQSLDLELIKKSIKISTFDSLRTDYSNYLENIKTQCLIESDLLNFINKALKRLWDVCDDVRCLWIKGTKLRLTVEDISHSVELYIQCLWYLTQILEKFVKKTRINPLNDLWSNLHHMLKIHQLNIPDDLSFKFDKKR